jgi:DNA-binding transcriptional ArsR family regulator
MKMAVTAQHQRTQTKRLKAMAHPLRASCLRLLIERGPMSPVQLAQDLGEALYNVSYHVRRLEKLDCIELVETRQVRGATEHFYAATERHALDLEEWERLVEADPLMAEGLVGEFAQKGIDDFVASREAGIVGMDENFHITRTPLTLDHEGLLEAVRHLDACQVGLAEIEKGSALRRASEGADGFPVSVALWAFETTSFARTSADGPTGAATASLSHFSDEDLLAEARARGLT